MDAGTGRLLTKLRIEGIDHNTLVIFTSEGWPTSNLPLRGGKGWMYESGIREPLLVRWPGVVPPGRVTATPVSSLDFFATLLEAAEATPQAPQTLDGTSLLSVFKRGSLPERALFWHDPRYENQGGALPQSGAATGN